MHHNHPKDILILLFDDLNPAQLSKAGLVCRQWRSASLINKLWNKFLDSDKIKAYMKDLPESHRVNEGFYHKLYNN